MRKLPILVTAMTAGAIALTGCSAGKPSGPRTCPTVSMPGGVLVPDYATRPCLVRATGSAATAPSTSRTAPQSSPSASTASTSAAPAPSASKAPQQSGRTASATRPDLTKSKSPNRTRR